MSEIINTYKLDNPFTLVPMDRAEFYKEQIEAFRKDGKPTRANETVNILIFNSHGEFTVQKRSFNKNHNPGLLDKSIGGHIQNGDTPDYTVMVETIQELQTPSIVLKDKIDFEKTYSLLSGYLETVALVYHLNTSLVIRSKVLKEGNEKVQIANKVHVYLGVYDGRMRPVDREASGILFYSLADLKKEIEKTPETFTEDLLFILRDFTEDIEKFIEFITKSK